MNIDRFKAGLSRAGLDFDLGKILGRRFAFFYEENGFKEYRGVITGVQARLITRNRLEFLTNIHGAALHDRYYLSLGENGVWELCSAYNLLFHVKGRIVFP